MNIVNISTFDVGGAAVAAIRISNAMRSLGINSNVLVREKRNQNSKVEVYANNLPKYLRGRLIGALNKAVSNPEVRLAAFGIDITHHPLVEQADVIIIHWINQFLSLKNIGSLIDLGKPVVFVLHDMWLYTGGCHYDKECGQYETGCKKCKQFSISAMTARHWMKKAEVFTSGAKTAFVGPCHWMVDELCRNPRYGDLKTKVIKHPIRTDIFSPNKNMHERKCLNGSKAVGRRKRIVFGAVLINEERKGMDLLVQALKSLEAGQFELVVYGGNKGKACLEIGLEYVDAGVIGSEEDMAGLLNSADVFVAPSRQENYANVVLEALACGVPVAAFNIGGMPDLIEHKHNGYLAKPFNTDDLAEGIRYCTENRQQLGDNARKRVSEENDEKLIARAYKELITELTDEKGV